MIDKGLLAITLNDLQYKGKIRSEGKENTDDWQTSKLRAEMPEFYENSKLRLFLL